MTNQPDAAERAAERICDRIHLSQPITIENTTAIIREEYAGDNAFLEDSESYQTKRASDLETANRELANMLDYMCEKYKSDANHAARATLAKWRK